MGNRLLLVLLAPLVDLSSARGDESPDARLRACVDAGNQGWVDGLEAGDARPIAAAYDDEGLDCTGAGECLKGRAAVEAHYAARIAKLGRAVSAEVRSKQIVRDGDYAYEWGRAEASFAGGKKIEGRYLTVWRLQKDGAWKIFRNVPLP